MAHVRRGGSRLRNVLKGFVSYAHGDHRACAKFRTHLRAVERALDVDFWADKRIRAGDCWNTEIARRIAEADVHLLLMSPGFFASDFIFDRELPAIAERCQRGALTIPVLMKRCSWEAFVAVLQVAPMNREGQLEAVADWKPRANGYDAAARQIGEAIQDRLARQPESPFAWVAP